MSTMTKKNKIILISVLVAVSLIVAVLTSLFLINYLGVCTTAATSDEATPDESTQDETVVNTESTKTTLPDGSSYTLTQDWSELAKINREIVGWMNVPNTGINYPVLFHSGDGDGYQYYLHRNYDQSYLFAGSLFIDYRSPSGVNSRNIIVHGHNMNNGSMFASLLNYGTYSGNLSYYQSAPTLFFNTPQGNEQWIIFAVYKTNTLEDHGEYFNYLAGDFSSDAQFMNYIYNIRERSFFDVPVPVNEKDTIITLSTCSYEYKDFRTVVVARKLRSGESASGYVSGASLNPDPVWPQVYYSDHGTKRPTLTTFKTEYQNGNIDWYDGSGKLSGNEWLLQAQGNKSFSVQFLDYDGSILSTQTVSYGEAAKPPKNPKKLADEYYTYEFIGWGYDFSSVKCDMIIAPKFEPIEK